MLSARQHFSFSECDIADADGLASVVGEGSYDVILHLAAQAGVRYGLIDPASLQEMESAIEEGCEGIDHDAW